MLNRESSPSANAHRHRLPIEHPEYLYPPSRNPYWTKLVQQKASVFSDHATEQLRGNWIPYFNQKRKERLNSNETGSPSQELHVEIGCNAGHVILEWAQSHPEKLFIGLDWKFKPIFRGMEKAINRNIHNLSFLRAHAERIQYIFGPKEIDRLYLFFPDPWPRQSQWKNRFINESSLRDIAPILKDDGIFHIKTDHPGYFDWMLDAVSKTNDLWEVIEMTRDLHQGNPAPENLRIPEVTLFEALFIRDQIPIQSLKLRPKRQEPLPG